MGTPRYLPVFVWEGHTRASEPEEGFKPRFAQAFDRIFGVEASNVEELIFAAVGCIAIFVLAMTSEDNTKIQINAINVMYWISKKKEKNMYGISKNTILRISKHRYWKLSCFIDDMLH